MRFSMRHIYDCRACRAFCFLPLTAVGNFQGVIAFSAFEIDGHLEIFFLFEVIVLFATFLGTDKRMFEMLVGSRLMRASGWALGIVVCFVWENEGWVALDAIALKAIECIEVTPTCFSREEHWTRGSSFGGCRCVPVT